MFFNQKSSIERFTDRYNVHICEKIYIETFLKYSNFHEENTL